MQGKPVVCEGIAQSCNIVEIKALDYVEGAGTDAELLRALYMSLQLGADIISCSWGGQENASSPEEDPYYKPIQALVQASIIPVFAAGNSGPNPQYFILSQDGYHKSSLLDRTTPLTTPKSPPLVLRVRSPTSAVEGLHHGEM